MIRDGVFFGVSMVIILLDIGWFYWIWRDFSQLGGIYIDSLSILLPGFCLMIFMEALLFLTLHQNHVKTGILRFLSILLFMSFMMLIIWVQQRRYHRERKNAIDISIEQLNNNELYVDVGV